MLPVNVKTLLQFISFSLSVCKCNITVCAVCDHQEAGEGRWRAPHSGSLVFRSMPSLLSPMRKSWLHSTRPFLLTLRRERSKAQLTQCSYFLLLLTCDLYLGNDIWPVTHGSDVIITRSRTKLQWFSEDSSENVGAVTFTPETSLLIQE